MSPFSGCAEQNPDECQDRQYQTSKNYRTSNVLVCKLRRRVLFGLKIRTRIRTEVCGYPEIISISTVDISTFQI